VFAQHSAKNKMSAQNLGMVFGIVLIKPPADDQSAVGSSMPKEVCTYLIEHVDDIFSQDSE
jgi:hypothetical protein